MREVLLPEDNSAAVYLRPSGSTEAAPQFRELWRLERLWRKRKVESLAVWQNHMVLSGLSSHLQPV
jgi:hypothetical protein